jgi:predicted alpha/beta-hydrolase family hydrolase
MTVHFLLAHGAGAPSSSAWMVRYRELLSQVGSVVTFDYPYMQARRKSPDKPDVLVASHRAQVEALRVTLPKGERLVLAGKSMGGRIGCHVALETKVSGLVCFGYPLRGQTGKLRDEVLLALETPILFVQGTRDTLCSLPELEDVRHRMKAPNELFVIEGGDHSLEATKTSLKARGTTQAEVEQQILRAVRAFCDSLPATQ